MKIIDKSSVWKSFIYSCVALLLTTNFAYALQVSPLSFDFGNVVYKKTSASQSVVITNDTPATITLNFGGGAAGIFGGSTSCPASLAPGVSCSVNYAYTPDQLGAQTDSTVLSLAGVIYAVAFKGNGVSGLLVAPTTFDFGDVFVGSSSISRDVTITNISNIPLVLNAAGGGAGLFGGTTSCGGITLAVGASCVFTYRFSPTAVGPQTGASSFTLAGTSFPLSFKGNGVSPIRISATDIDFGPVIIGTASPEQLATVTNLTTVPVLLSSVAGGGISAPFGASQSCAGITLAAGATCAFFYRFSPTVAGAQVGTTSFSINGLNAAINVAGVGVSSIPAGSLRVTPRSLDYANVARGSTSGAQSITITNVSAAAITLGLAGGGAGIFGGSTSCASSLAPGGACTINYAYAPTAFGAQTGSTSFTAAGVNYPISFKGNGITGLVVTPTVFDFGDAVFGASSLPRRMLVTNTTSSAITLNLAGGGAGIFGGATDCTAGPLAAGATCYIEYKYTPTALGSQTGASSATIAGISYPISFAGNGISGLRVSPLSFDFGRVQIGATSPQQLVTITNTSGVSLTPSYAGGGIAAPFNAVQNCAGVTLAAGASCSFFYNFSPTAIGSVTGATSIFAGGGNYNLAFKGTGANGTVITRAINDLNADGKSDLIFRNGATGQISAWLMNGTAAVSTAGLVPPGNWTVTHTGDFNGDGKADVLYRNDDGSVTLWLMNGLTVTSSVGLLGPSPDWRVSHVGDFNGDGKADILWRNTNGAVTLWLMDGTTVTSTVGLLGPNPDWSVSHVADFNGDGRADILWRNTSGAVTMWLMNGVAISSATGLIGPDPNWRVSHVADFDGDGKTDLLWRNTNGAVTVWLMNGSSIVSTAGLLGPDANWSVSHTGDFNGDGKADLLWRNTNGAVTMWLMNGVSIASTAGILGPDPNWRVSHLGDYNGDGNADLVWRNASDGAITMWLMNGATTLSAAGILGASPWSVVPPMP